jgi:hypothetical protein
MTVFINGAELEKIDQLSDNMQTIIQLIPDAVAWCDNSIDDSEHTLRFDTDEQFIEQLMPSLHSTNILYLKRLGLLVGCKKLLDLPNNDIRDLYYLNNSKNEETLDGPQLKLLINKHKLLDEAELITLNQFYERLGISQHTLIKTASLDDQVCLYDTLKYTNSIYKFDHTVSSHAANWAFTKAINLAKFAHFYCLYITWYLGSNQIKSNQFSATSINNIIEKLTPVVLESLNCPIVTHVLDKKRLRHAVNQWVEVQKGLGFKDISSGLLSIALNINLNQEASLVQQANDYISRLQYQLASHDAEDAFVNQSGHLQMYEYKQDSGTILLSLNAQGCLSIFGHWPKS